ncbi:MAG: exo-alpha-sialidase, partial [Acidobacteria bacterium]|nr:exo-alpha-sialidase [Acidobacteriota bacterium]
QGHAGPSHAAPSYADLYFARSTDGGKTFSTPVRVNDKPNTVRPLATSKPRLVVGANGTIHVLWVAIRQNADKEVTVLLDMHYARSSNGGKSFEKARALNTDRNLHAIDHMGIRAEHAFQGMAVTPKGEVHTFWIDSRDMSKESDKAAIYGAVSKDDGKTWLRDRMVIKTDVCACCQVTAASGKDGAVYLTWRNIFADGSREIVLVKSTDGGKAYSAPVRLMEKKWVIEGCPLKPASVAIDGKNNVWVSWYTEADQPAGAYLVVSTDGGKSFSVPQAVQANVKGADHAQVVPLPNGETLLAWDARIGETRSVLMRKAALGKGVALSEPMMVAAATYPALGVAANGIVYCSFVQNGRLMLQVMKTEQLTALK